MPIYLDNSSTTFPKPPAVVEAISRYLTDCGANVSRGGYRAAYAAEDLVFSTRERLAALFRAPDCKCVSSPKSHDEPQRSSQGISPSGRPCAGVLDGAQRRHAPTAAIGSHRRKL